MSISREKQKREPQAYKLKTTTYNINEAKKQTLR